MYITNKHSNAPNFTKIHKHFDFCQHVWEQMNLKNAKELLLKNAAT